MLLSVMTWLSERPDLVIAGLMALSAGGAWWLRGVVDRDRADRDTRRAADAIDRIGRGRAA